MKIAVASDHRGFEAKKRSLPVISRLGHQINDLGCHNNSACDYPDYASLAARAVARGEADCGIMFDGTGIGMSVVANKICGVRAAVVHDEVTARRSREHNHCNVLCLGTDLLNDDHIKQIIEIFLSTPFQEGRHDRRIAKIKAIEQEEQLAREGK